MTEQGFDEEALAEAYRRALRHEKAGALSLAAAAYNEMLRLDPDDRAGASVRLAGIGHGAVPERAPALYVATLFDQHAEVFDTMLVEQLGYAAPMQLREILHRVRPSGFERFLDLGCGTGLLGEAIEDRTRHRTGVDLSEGMIEIADEKEVYNDLFLGDIQHFLQTTPGPSWDLIAATDVLPYLGDLGPLFAATARWLQPGGLFAVSTEDAPTGLADGFGVGSTHRFGHSAAYLDCVATANGLHSLQREPITVRFDEGSPVTGALMVWERAGP
ncbi:MAG: methyltransferase domain-containing protein [Pseudomonadota bacterium]